MQNILTGKRSSALLAVILVVGVACATANPLDRLRSELDPYPEYSVILQDMKTTGNFIDEYHHQYKVLYGVKGVGDDAPIFHEKISDWIPVDRKIYEKYQPYLGMTILSKGADGRVEEAFFPPHYQWVGDSRYGRWVDDGRGDSFWEFYGKYALFSAVIEGVGDVGKRAYRSRYNDYRSHRSAGRPYFGHDNNYGTRGSYTKSTHRSFYQRQEARQQAKRESFSRKVQSRTRRSNMSGFRSRSSSSRGGK